MSPTEQEIERLIIVVRGVKTDLDDATKHLSESTSTLQSIIKSLLLFRSEQKFLKIKETE